MARVFTISFEFWGEQHVAMVTLSEEQENVTSYHVRLLNLELHQIIPQGIISFTSTDNSLPAQVQNHVAEELFLIIRKALNVYLSQPLSPALE